MAFDYKQEYKEYYAPSRTPGILTIPPMNYIAVRGQGDPNVEGGEYKQAIEMLYGVAYTIKMSEKGSHKIKGYFPYVVPPLEGLWWQKGSAGIDDEQKEKLQWISMIRLPDFVERDEFLWAAAEAAEKKKKDFSKVEFFCYDEGECVQCMHVGSYDRESTSIERMNVFVKEQGYELDITSERYHHEIYLSNPVRTAKDRLRTVIRQPVKRR